MKNEDYDGENVSLHHLTSLLRARYESVKKEENLIKVLLSNLKEYENRVYCPACLSKHIRVNVNNIFCKKCGRRYERVGDRLILKESSK